MFSDRKIDSKEMKVINDSINNITWEAKIFLKALPERMHKEKFSTIDITWYNSFKKFLDSKLLNGNIKIPSWTDLEKAVINQLTNVEKSTFISERKFNSKDFHWIDIKWNTIGIKYYVKWIEHLLEVKYNSKTGIIIQKPKWKKDKEVVNLRNEFIDTNWNLGTILKNKIAQATPKKATKKQSVVYWAQKTPKNKTKTNDKQIKPKKTTHKVKKWETLWNIVRKHYKLKNNTEIAKMVNYVVDNQEKSKMATRLWKDTNPKKFRDGIKW
jgi:hypothetical protein